MVMVIFPLSPLRAGTSDNYCYRDSWNSDNFSESNQEKKQRTDTINKAKKIKSVMFTRDNIAILENE